MITAQVTSTGFSIKGHAGYAPEGRDIICAGVSAIAQTAILGLQHFDVNMHVEADKGLLTCNVQSDMPEARTILQVLKLGLDAIADGYPEHVAVI
jgi:uncharacterized protein YsxB (DUF464 family)